MKIKACNALNAMFVETVDTYTGVCGSYTTPYTEYYEVCKLCTKWPLTPARREGYCVSLLSCGFSCSPILGGSFVNFLGLDNYKGDCRQDIQPTPNS